MMHLYFTVLGLHPYMPSLTISRETHAFSVNSRISARSEILSHSFFRAATHNFVSDFFNK